VIRQSWHFT